jgi:hypothetical protein
MRTAFSSGITKILPSPIWPVRAAPAIASITLVTRSAATATSISRSDTLSRIAFLFDALTALHPFRRNAPGRAVHPFSSAAVADLAGAGGTRNRVDHARHEVGGDRHLDLELGQEAHGILEKAVRIRTGETDADAL